jgi:hypothetical protein
MENPPQLRSRAYERRKSLGCDAGYISALARTDSGEGVAIQKIGNGGLAHAIVHGEAGVTS